MKGWFREKYRLAATGALPSSDSRWFRWLLDGVHVTLIVSQQTARDKLHVRAATLAYWTAVGMVPLLVLAFALTGPLGLHRATMGAVRKVLYSSVLASGSHEVGQTLDMLLSRVDLGTLGALGVIGIMFIGSQLYFAAELAYNDVFSCRVQRSWMLRFVLFNAAILGGPLLVAGGFLVTAQLPTESNIFERFIPVAMTATALVGAIKLLPNTRVAWQSAIVGGFISAALFEGAKLGFGAYTEMLGTKDNMTRLYGSVAFLPVFLLWLNVLWLVVLVGVEMAFVTQNRHGLLDMQREVAADPHAARRSPDALFAIGVMATLVHAVEAAEGPVDIGEIVERTRVHQRHIKAALSVLVAADLITCSLARRYMTARPPSEITAAEVAAAWQSLATPVWPGGTGMAQIVAAMRARLTLAMDTDLATLANQRDG